MLIVFLILVYLYLVSSVIACALYVISGNNFEYGSKFKKFLYVFFGFGGLIGLVLFLEPGFERVLFFLPDDWGKFDIDVEEWVSTKETISNVLAMFTGIGIFIGAGKIKALKDQADKYKEKEKNN